MWTKYKGVIRLTVISLLVYMIFRYLLPLVLPFLLAAAAAVLLRPSAYWISERLQISWRGRQRRVSVGLIGFLELAGISAALTGFIWQGGKVLARQIRLLAEQLPLWVGQLDAGLTGACQRIEVVLSLKKGTMITAAREMIRSMGDTAKRGTMPYLMENSVSIASACINAAVLLLVFIIGVVLFLQEWESWKEKMLQSAFHEEWIRLWRVLKLVANAYLRTQGLIILLTSIICAAGLWLLGNPYFILLGIVIGCLDALPVLGTGMILIPWALILLILRQWGRAVIVLGLYLCCYLVRELVETKMMGDKVGLSPLETLIAVYVGLKLFGVMGVILGPIGVLVVKEFV